MITAQSIRMMMLYVLAYFSIGCFKVGTSDVRASDVVPLIDDQAKDGDHGLMIKIIIHE